MTRTTLAVDDMAAALAFDAAPEDESASLHSQGLADPELGTPLTVTIAGQSVDIEPGTWRAGGFANEWGLPPGCPVTPLGVSDDQLLCYVLDSQGVVRSLDARSSGKGPLGFLFAGRSRWLEWAFPRMKVLKSGHAIPAGGWDADDARQCLVDACAFKGVFDPEQQVRGRGAWRDDDGGLIYHAGDRIWLGGHWKRPGEYGQRIYPARPRLQRPWPVYEKAGSDSPGDMVLQELRSWNWERPDLDPQLLLGWLIGAMVGGALKDRPTIFIPGEEGSGKSRLQQLMRLLMGDALMDTEDATGPSIYRRVRQDSVAILIDELEAVADSRVTDKIMTIMRISYSGGKLHRTGENGRTQEFTLRSSCAGSAIAKPATTSADDSRMAVTMLREREPGQVERVLDGKMFTEAGRQLLKRVFDWWPRWDELRRVYRTALTAKECGHTDRGGDTFAALVAGYHVATSDDMPTPAELAMWQKLLKAEALTETSTREKTWRRCFIQLLEAQPDVFRQLACKSLGQAIVKWREAPTANYGTDVEDKAAQIGLAISWERGADPTWENARLFVPAKSAAVQSLFEGTDWAGKIGAPGPWSGVLRQMPKHLWENGKCEKGLDTKASGIYIRLAAALEV